MEAAHLSASQRWLAWGLGLVELVFCLVASVWLLFRPALFQVYYPLLRVPASRADAARVVEWIAGDEPQTALQRSLTSGRMSERELNHFQDVRAVIQRAPGLLAMGTAALVAVVLFRPPKRVWRHAQKAGLVIWAVTGLGAVLLAAWDWRVLFAWLHQPFFGTTSWRLPNGCLSLQLYPERFWQFMAGCAALCPACVLAAACVALREREMRSGAGSPP